MTAGSTTSGETAPAAPATAATTHTPHLLLELTGSVDCSERGSNRRLDNPDPTSLLPTQQPLHHNPTPQPHHSPNAHHTTTPPQHTCPQQPTANPPQSEQQHANSNCTTTGRMWAFTTTPTVIPNPPPHHSQHNKNNATYMPPHHQNTQHANPQHAPMLAPEATTHRPPATADTRDLPALPAGNPNAPNSVPPPLRRSWKLSQSNKVSLSKMCQLVV